jgi:hypothetical protein
MKVKITSVKAPWPSGAQVGDVVEFEGDKAPAWAAGKFTPAPDDAEAAHKYLPQLEVHGDGTGPVLPAIGEVNLAVAELQQQLSSAGETIRSLQAENITLHEQLVAAGARIKQFEAAAAKGSDIDAQAAAEAARAKLETEAKELGVDFRSNISDEKLAERVAEARAAKR